MILWNVKYFAFAALQKLRDKYFATQLIKRQSCHHIETSQLSSSANQLTGFCMMETLAFNKLKYWIAKSEGHTCEEKHLCHRVYSI